MPTVVLPSYFWSQDQVTSFHTDDGGAWISGTPSVDFQVALTLFSRAPSYFTNDAFAQAPAGVPWTNDPNSVPPATINDLWSSPFWTLPVQADGSRVVVAGYSSYIVDPTDDPTFRIIPESLVLPGDDPHFHDIPIYPFTGPVVAFALWLSSGISSSTNVGALLAIARFDAALLMQGTSTNPSYLSIDQSLLLYKYTP